MKMFVSKIWLYFPKDETRGSALLDLILTSEEELVEELNRTILRFNIPSNEKLNHSCKCTLWIMMYYRKRSVMFDFFFTGIFHNNSYDDNLIMWNRGGYSGTCWQKAFHKHKDPIFYFGNKSSASDPETF